MLSLYIVRLCLELTIGSSLDLENWTASEMRTLIRPLAKLLKSVSLPLCGVQ